jgi:hypothetical protein
MHIRSMSKRQGNSSVVRLKQAAHCSNTDSSSGQKSRDPRTAELAATGHTVTSNAKEVGRLKQSQKMETYYGNLGTYKQYKH